MTATERGPLPVGALASLRAAIIDAVRGALSDLAPARLVEQALPPRPPKRARVVVAAVGKAAAAMAEGALRRWPDAPMRVLVVTTDPLATAARTSLRACQIPVDIHASAHPVPDARSAASAEACLAAARDLESKDLLLALVSGGSSSLLALPPAGLSIEDKSEVVGRLLAAGVPIQDVNTVRRHLSRIKGGRLAEAAWPARVLSLIISDVIGGEPQDVGSGPTVADPTTVDRARAVLADAAPDLGAKLEAHLSETLKPDAPAARRNRARVLAGPDELAATVCGRLAAAGIAATTARAEEGAADDIAGRRVDAAKGLERGAALVIPCEPTIALPRCRGRGGRAGWTALAAARSLPDDCVLVCVASDGVDGASGAAGAAITRADVVGRDAEVDRALTGFDDAALHQELGTNIVLGPTGTNMTDVHVVARAAST